jgi:uncharacterized membrane protein YebE (DUF533 family)
MSLRYEGEDTARQFERHGLLVVDSSMSDLPNVSIKDKVAAAAVTGAGASVGGAGGATVGVLELAARGAATGLSAGLVIGAGAAAGAALAYGVYRLFRTRRLPRTQTPPKDPAVL